MLRMPARYTAALTALSFAVALVVSVVSVSHAPAVAAETASEPCTDHHVPEPNLFAATCASLCDAVDLDHLIAVVPDRLSVHEIDLPQSATAAIAPSLQTQLIPRLVLARAPPPTALYLTTQRLRI